MVAETTERSSRFKPLDKPLPERPAYNTVLAEEIAKARKQGREPKPRVTADLAAADRQIWEQTKPLSRVIRERREELQMTQGDLAKAVNIKSSEFIGMVEAGLRNLELNKIPLLARALHLDKKKLCRLALFETAPQFAIDCFGDKVETFIPTEKRGTVKEQQVTMSPEQVDFSTKLWNLPSPLRFTILDLVEKFTTLVREGPSRLRRA